MVSRNLCYRLNLLIFLQIISVSFGYAGQQQQVERVQLARETIYSNSTQALADVSSNNIATEPVYEKNAFMEWLASILTPTKTTTLATPTDVPTTCEPCTCGKVNTQKRIVGGIETVVNMYPWMAMLLYSNRFYCGGSLINDRYVLTASHCVSGFNKDRITVRLLEHDRSTATESTTITRRVKDIIKHTSYNGNNYDNDIALLRLDSPVEFSEPLRPVCLPTPGKSFTGFNGVVAGWGATMENGDIAVRLQEVTVPIMSNAECRKTGYGPRKITDNMLCAGFKEGKKDSCQGDSGGPLHIIDTTNNVHQIAGVVSWGEGCAKPNYPGVYSRVNRYGTWIKSLTKDACYCS